jgi:hypothetical protein
MSRLIKDEFAEVLRKNNAMALQIFDIPHSSAWSPRSSTQNWGLPKVLDLSWSMAPRSSEI